MCPLWRFPAAHIHDEFSFDLMANTIQHAHQCHQQQQHQHQQRRAEGHQSVCHPLRSDAHLVLSSIHARRIFQQQGHGAKEKQTANLLLLFLLLLVLLLISFRVTSRILACALRSWNSPPYLSGRVLREKKPTRAALRRLGDNMRAIFIHVHPARYCGVPICVQRRFLQAGCVCERSSF